MVMANNIFDTKKPVKALCFAMFFVVLSVAANVVSAQEGAKTIKVSIEAKEAAKTAPQEIAPTYYKEDATLKEDGSVDVKNSQNMWGNRPYDEEDTEHLLNMAKKGATGEDLAKLMATYPTTLGLVDYVQPSYAPTVGVVGSGYYQLRHEYAVMNNLRKELKDNKLSKEEYDRLHKVLSDAFDRHTAYYAKKNNNESLAETRVARISGDLKRGEISQEDAERRIAEMQKIAQGIKDAKIEHFTNEECVIEDMQKKYQSSCYSCIIVKTLISTFMSAAGKTYDITRQAGVAVLFVGTILWIAIFGLKSVSAFTNQDPEKNLDDLLSLLFRVLVAYVVITAGINVIVYYFINPILAAGADYGIGVLNSSAASLGLVNIQDIPAAASYKYTEDSIISAELINKILTLNQAIDREVSTNLVVGEALMCHAFNAGMIKVGWESINVTIPDIWIWLCGAAIWFVGFMLTLAVSYYLLDVSFKLGFAVIALPVVIGLWPFAPTKDKLKTCMSIIIGAAGTFAFLAITTSYALVLIGESIRGVDELYTKIKANDAKWIEVTFALTGSYFLIIIFSYLYSMKLIMSTITDFSNKFFGDGVFGGASPMHEQARMFTQMASNATIGAAKGTVKAASKGAGKVGNFIGSKFKGSDAKKADDKNKKEGQNVLQSGGQGVKNAGAGVQTAGKGTKQAGKTMEQTGKATEQAGKATKQTGEGVDKAGQGVTKSGQSMIKGGAALSGTGLGAIIGVPMMIAGAAVTVGGAATQATGKAVKAAGSVVEQTGKVVKNAGKAVRKVGEGIEKAGKTISKAGDKVKSVGDKWREKGDTMRKGNENDTNDGNNE